MNARVQQALADYDGKHVDVLEGVLDVTLSAALYKDVLKKVTSDDPKVADAATWLLRAWVMNGRRLSDDELQAWLDVAKTSDQWAPTLHFLQTLASISLPETLEADIYDFCQGHTSHKNKMVRAWAFNGLSLIALQNGSYLDKTRQSLEKGLKDTSPAVAARVKRSVKRISDD